MAPRETLCSAIGDTGMHALHGSCTAGRELANSVQPCATVNYQALMSALCGRNTPVLPMQRWPQCRRLTLNLRGICDTVLPSLLGIILMRPLDPLKWLASAARARITELRILGVGMGLFPARLYAELLRLLPSLQSPSDGVLDLTILEVALPEAELAALGKALAGAPGLLAGISCLKLPSWLYVRALVKAAPHVTGIQELRIGYENHKVPDHFHARLYPFAAESFAGDMAGFSGLRILRLHDLPPDNLPGLLAAAPLSLIKTVDLRYGYTGSVNIDMRNGRVWDIGCQDVIARVDDVLGYVTRLAQSPFGNGGQPMACHLTFDELVVVGRGSGSAQLRALCGRGVTAYEVRLWAMEDGGDDGFNADAAAEELVHLDFQRIQLDCLGQAVDVTTAPPYPPLYKALFVEDPDEDARYEALLLLHGPALAGLMQGGEAWLRSLVGPRVWDTTYQVYLPPDAGAPADAAVLLSNRRAYEEMVAAVEAALLPLKEVGERVEATRVPAAFDDASRKMQAAAYHAAAVPEGLTDVEALAVRLRAMQAMKKRFKTY
ncbi:hypothetical protein HYH03_011058 [Edaphochlamys debaryana]|uniref:Uncharacterized protein n=1 Tax=Edaphochlamys debaryana TaxID=47281 RepID=A0A836BVV7_9CHLO|nr:hypothetical protein HYH03_011058 [Edaphochlamys debaryana]|eukprot:KAG2490422.1 hypothetical protein HYH03_011058 [Edaphochlamys debaryana]